MALTRVFGRSALLVVIAPSGLTGKMAFGERSFAVALPGFIVRGNEIESCCHAGDLDAQKGDLGKPGSGPDLTSMTMLT